MDEEALREKIELDILAIIEEKLRNGQMDVARAKAIARMVLDKLHPLLSLEQVYQIAPTLDDHFTELAKAVLPIMEEHEDRLKEIVSTHAEKMIASGKIDEALALLKNSDAKQQLITK